MSKTAANVLKFIVSKIEVGVSSNGSIPSSWMEVGFMGETVLKVEMKASTYATGDGSEFQKAYDCTVETNALEVLNFSTIESLVKNNNIWIKATPAGTVSSTNPIVKVTNFIANMEASLDLSVKGKNGFKITGKKFAVDYADFITTASS